MSFRKLLLKGILGLALMGSIQAAPSQAPGGAQGNGNLVLVYWCGPDHNHWCHPHHYRYHESFEEHVRHCRHHPHSWDCERFCELQAPLCYPHRGW
jgi:hypothetical protein